MLSGLGRKKEKELFHLYELGLREFERGFKEKFMEGLKGILLRICALQTPNKTQLKTNSRTQALSYNHIYICVHQFISHLSLVDLGLT